MNYKAIIFDLDGTIVKTEQLWVQAACIILEKRNITLSAPEHAALEVLMNGLDVSTMVVFLQKRYLLSESTDKFYKEITSIAHHLYKTGLIFEPGFLEFVNKLVLEHVPIAIATNSDKLTTNLVATSLNLSQYFGPHIYNVEDVKRRAKPLPDLYLYAAEKLNIEPTLCIAIEDSKHGVQAAHAAGMKCIGINSHNDPIQIQQADVIVNGYNEITTEMLDTL